MNVLAAYDQARASLAQALKSTDIRRVATKHFEFDHIKLHARRVQDRELLAVATEYQMRAERWLGELLERAQAAGQLAGPGRIWAKGEARPATLKDIGVEKRLSVAAKRAAALDPAAFEEVISGTRDKIKSGKAILVDPIQTAHKSAELDKRRADHAARTEGGGCVADLGKLVREGRKFKSVASDPQWKFLTRSAAGDGRSANVHYKTEEVDKIKNLPVGELLADDGAFYMWMVDWCPQDALDLLSHYGLRHVTTAFTWVKTNGETDKDGFAHDIWANSTWHMGQGYWTRANPEACWLATKGNPVRLHADVRQLIVAPVMEHSRKPDEFLDRIERLTEGDYLELQARRPRRRWVSWGDELEFTGVAA